MILFFNFFGKKKNSFAREFENLRAAYSDL